MTHLDEGTIHAWLDGALDAERAREVEAHVRDCAQCSSAVAEARGLVAASSRILSALDDVPGKVIPAPAKVRPPKRMWRAAPWVTGIAAILLAAIVLRTSREAPSLADQAAKMEVAERSARATLDSMEPRRTANAAAELAPVAAPPQVAASAGAGGPVSTSKASDMARPSAAVGQIASVGGREPSAETQQLMAERREQTLKVREPTADVQEPRAESRAPTTADDAMRRRVALAPPRTISDIIVTGVGIPLDSLPAGDLAGCYVFERRIGIAKGIAATAEVATTSPRTRAAAGAAAAPAPTAQAQRAEYTTTRSLMLVRLDTLRGRPGFIVRSATSDSSLGWWNRIGRDSARVDLLTAGALTFSRSQRVACPEQ